MFTISPESPTVNAQSIPPPARLVEPSRKFALAILLLVITLFGVIRYRLRDMPLERDEGEYAYSGQLMLQGIPPYKLAYNMKLPGIYAAYAAVMAIFGETPAGIHLGLLLVNAASVVLLYLLASLLFGRLAGIIAACSYALLKRPELSIKTLRRAIELGYRDFRYIREDHDLDIIRKDPRYRQLLREFETR